jgi:ubiquinol-cytochrome c reductase iron-sulfur subunit
VAANSVRRRRRDVDGRRRPRERIVEPHGPDRRAELVITGLFVAAALAAAAFVVFYAVDASTQVLGGCLGGCLALLAVAVILMGSRLLPDEQLPETYPEPDPASQQDVAQIVRESTEGITRKKLIGTAAGVAGGCLGVALVTPAVSLGPLFDTGPLYETPWRRGRALVDEEDKPILADDIEAGAFYTAYPEGAKKDQIGAPLVVVRLDPAALHLPAGREDWAPDGVLAFSKICTHAGCAIALYRKPLFPSAEDRPALVCPCHYSTFDPARGAEVIYGPAGRPLPQLPLMVDASGALVAGGNYSGAVGPSWSGVRSGRPT